MIPALDRAAGWSDSLIRHMDAPTLARVIHRFGPSHGFAEPTFNTRQPSEHEVDQMRNTAFAIRDRAKAN